MNCSRFRHFIQQRFDMELPAQDERMLSAHLETCESCAKFHHQIQQVLMASDDVQLPDEMLPPQPESLARAIMEHLPQPKASPFAFLLNMFGGGAPKQKKEKPAKEAKQKKQPKGKKAKQQEAIETASRFPHRSQLPPPDIEQEEPEFEPAPPAMQAPPQQKVSHPRAKEADHSGTATRLKAIAKGFSEPLTQDSREAQSTTRSLGEKFGMAGPSASAEDQPLTLAESIRRKIAESQRATGEHAPIDLAEQGEPLTSQEDPGWTKPPTLPGRQPVNPPTGLPSRQDDGGGVIDVGQQSQSGGQGEASPSVLGNWGRPSPIESSAWGGGGGPAPAAKAEPSPWDAPPTPPTIEEAAQAADGRGWNDNPPKGSDGRDGDWGPPPQGGAWDEPAEASPGQGFSPSSPAGLPPSSLKQKGASDSTAPPLTPGANWAAPAGAQGAGAQGAAAPGNSSQPWAQPPKAPEGWPSPGGQNAAWGQESKPAAAAAAQAPPQPAAPQATPQSGKDPWSQGAASGQAAWGQGGNWSAPAGQQVPDSWAKAPSENNETQPGQGKSAAWGQPSGGPGWTQPGGQSEPQPAQGAGAGWGAPQTGGPGGGWTQPSQGGWQMPASAPAQQASPVQQAPAAAPSVPPDENRPSKKSNYAMEADQVETGTWRAFSAGDASLGAQTGGWDNAGAQQQPETEAARWDVPIQERMKQQAQGQGQPQPSGAAPLPAPGAAAPSQQPPADRWDVPIQERQQQQAQQPQPQSQTGGWAMPGQQAAQAPQPAAGAQAGGPGGLPRDSIMDRLSSVLSAGEGQGNAMSAAQAPGADRWDVPIQDRMNKEAQAPQAQAPAQAPQAQQAPQDARWDMPIQDRMKQQAAETSPELSPPPPRWDQAVQERTQQLSPTVLPQPQEQISQPWPAPGDAQSTPQAQAWGAQGQAEAASAPTASSWDLPVVESQAQLHGKGGPGGLPKVPPLPAQQAFNAASQGFAPPGQPGQPPAQQPAQPVQQTAAQAAAPQQTGQQADNKQGSLFNLDDNAIDRIFTEHLGINDTGSGGGQGEAARPTSAPAIMKSIPSAAPQETAVQQQTPATPPPLPGAPSWGTPAGEAAPAKQPPWGQPGQQAAPAAWASPGEAQAQPAQAAFAAPDNSTGGQPGAWSQPQEPAAAQQPAWGQPPAPAPNIPPQPPAYTPPPGYTPPQPFGQPQQVQGQDGGAPKIVPVMSRSSGTASGGVPTSKPAPPAWGVPSSGGSPSFSPQDKAPSNGPHPSPAVSSPPQPAAASGLFNLDDSAMDDLFSKNLGVTEAATPVGGQPPQQPAFASMPAPAAVAPAGNMGAPPLPAPGQPFMAAPPMPQVPTLPNAPMPSLPQAQAAQQQSAPPQIPGMSPPPQVPGMPPQMPGMAPPQVPGMPSQMPGMTPPQVPGMAPPPLPNIPPLPTPAPAPFEAQPPAAPPPQIPQQQQGQQQGLFNIDDSLMNKIFADNLGVQEPQQQPDESPKVNVTDAVRAISDAVTPPVGGPAPKIEGLGRLDPKTDATGDSGSGRIASIGKFLLDQKDLEKIGKLTASDLSDTKMKILTLEAASEIQSLLHHISGQQGVVGSIIIGHDGLLIANTMPGDVEADSIGIWALAVYMNTETAVKKIGHERVHQIVSKTPRGYLVIADFGGGLLVTLSDGKDTDALIPLMRSITQVVSQ